MSGVPTDTLEFGGVGGAAGSPIAGSQLSLAQPTALKPVPPSTSADMAASDRLDWLSNRVDQSLTLVAEKRARFQKAASRIQVTTIALTGGVSLCLGLDMAGIEGPLKATAFVFGVVVTLMNAIEPYFNMRALWIEHEDAKFRLHRLRDRIDFYRAGLTHEPICAEAVLEFEKQHQDIWERVSTEWLSRRRYSNGSK
jgi:hypothetical protein